MSTLSGALAPFFRFREPPLTPPIPTTEPERLVAGDTWKWTRSIADYPASDGYVLSYDVSGPANFVIAATADGSGYAITHTAQNVPPGTYRWAARVTKAGERFTVDRGVFVIEADLPGQTHAERMLALVETVIAARLGGDGADVSAYTIGGRSAQLLTLAELEALRSRYASDAARQRRGNMLRPVLVSFNA